MRTNRSDTPVNPRQHRSRSAGSVNPRTIGYGGGTTHPAPEAAIPKTKKNALREKPAARPAFRKT